MNNIALQLASFLSQLQGISLSQYNNISTSIDLLAVENRKRSNGFLDGAALGAFICWSVLSIEDDVRGSANLLADALHPLGLDREMRAISEERLLRPGAMSRDLVPDLKKAQKVIKGRIELLASLQEQLLQVTEEHAAEVYSEEAVGHFQRYWQKELRQLLDEEGTAGEGEGKGPSGKSGR